MFVEKIWGGEMLKKFLFVPVFLIIIFISFTGTFSSAQTSSSKPTLQNPTSSTPVTPSPSTSVNITPADTESPTSSFKVIRVKKGSSHEDPAIGIIFPPKLGDLELEDITQFTQPGLGYKLRYFYTLPEWIKVDLYVYNKQLSSIPDGIYSKTVQTEFFALGRDIEKQSSYQGVKKIAVGVFSKNRPVQLLWSCYEFSVLPQPGVRYPGPRVSESYITGFRNHFIKVRATYWKNLEQSGKKLTSFFIDHLSELLESSRQVETPQSIPGVKRVAILEEKGEWLHVYIEDGTEKWIRKPAMTTTPPVINVSGFRIVYVKWPTVGLREGPGMNFKTLVEIKKGTRVSVLEDKGQWLRVSLEDGREGWIGKATISETP